MATKQKSIEANIEPAKKKPVLIKKAVKVASQTASPIASKQFAKEVSASPVEKLASKDSSKPKEIAETLGEKHFKVIPIIKRIIETVGLEQVEKLVTEAQAIYSSGEGIYLPKFKRNRTLGGVFLNLARKSIGNPLWAKKICPKYKPIKKSPKINWEELIAKAVKLQSGECMSSMIRLVGRPTTIEKEKTFVSFILESPPPATPSKDLPEVKTSTKYLVLATKKQWTNVKTALKETDKNLTIEGYGTIKPGFDGIILIATTVIIKGQSSKVIAPEVAEIK